MRRIAAVLLIVLLLVGCADLQTTLKKVNEWYLDYTSSIGLTDVQRATLEGGVTLGALGAIAGNLIGKDTKSTVIGAGAGLIIGSLGANWYARKVAARTEELKKQEKDLDARIQYARGVNSDARLYINNLEKQLEEANSKIEDLRIKQKQNKISKEELKKERTILADKIKVAEDNKALLKAQLDELKKYRHDNNVKSGQLDKEIASLQNELDEVEELTLKLASIDG
jgi:hypothetical protein